ncbi:MAG TPA: DUF885 domain-containing protein [Steroidobacteraceae bacterium]|nr:DUF885 domain-containing protein [Steroidobacteraceae bacterium]
MNPATLPRLRLASILFALSLQPAVADDVAKLHALFDSAWQRDLQENPVTASDYGDLRYNDQWGDNSIAAREKSDARDRQVLADLAAIPRASLPPAEQLNYDLFEREYRARTAAFAFKPYQYAITQRDGVQSLNEVTEFIPLQSAKHYEDWIARLNGIGTVIDQTIDLLRAGIREKRTQPRVIMDRIPGQFALHLVAKPEDSPFWAPFRQFPDSVTPADQQRLAAAGRQAIEKNVLPAYRRFNEFFTKEYLPASRQSVGIWDTPRGAQYYQNRIEYYTTTKLTADEIHALGLKEVARIRAQMEEIIRQVKFQGTFAEFLNFLRTDSQFYYKSSEELLQAYQALTRRIDPELVKLFGKLPRTPYGVRPIPMTSAPNTTTAYYQPPALDGTRAGYYYVNLYKPEVRPKYEMEVLSVHEAVPGHHLQIALATELGELPMFRRNARFTAYIEGWGLYSESLGEALGLYQDPYSKFGQLTYEMWRAVRLVVDTGLHHKRWTRQQAIDYFEANAAKTEADIVNEIDRYIVTPGQALAYKIGELKIKELRARAQERLGERFDIRKFHDTVLGSGAVPLDVLEKSIDAWIAGESGAAKAAAR